MKLNGVSEVLVFEATPEPIQPGGELVRIRERVSMPASVVIARLGGGVRVSASWHMHVFGRDEFQKKQVTVFVESLRFSTHRDQFGGLWQNLRGSGNKGEVWLSTPSETWQRLHVWIRLDILDTTLRGAVRFEIIELDAGSAAAMREFAARFSQYVLELGL